MIYEPSPLCSYVSLVRTMTTLLEEAIDLDDVDRLYSFMEQEANRFDRAFQDPLPNTPLHCAAEQGKTRVAMDIAILKPLSARKLGRGGYSPMHLALQKKHYHTVRALMNFDPELIRVRRRCGITPLHYVAEKEGDEELQILAEFPCACQSSTEDLTNRCETAIHVAIKNHNLKAFEVLFGWLQRVYLTEFFNWKDEDGNTILHMAASQGNRELTMRLSKHADVNAENFHGETALNIFQAKFGSDQDVVKNLRRQERLTAFLTPKLPLPRLISTRLTFLERWAFIFNIQDESARNIILLVSTLVATATYQAALSPPGGYSQDLATNSTDIANGKPHQVRLLRGYHLFIFALANSVAFLCSICIILATAIPLLPDTGMVCGSVFSLIPTYFYSLEVGFQFQNSSYAALIESLIFPALCAFFLVHTLKWVTNIRVKKHINATRRRVGNSQRRKDRR